MILAIEPAYYRSVSQAHVELDPTAFLHEISNIGICFREKIFYPALVQNPDSFVWIYLHDGKTAGYIAGTKNARKLYHNIICFKPFLLALLVLKNICRRPCVLIEYLRIRGQLKHSHFKSDGRAEILSLGVLPEFRGKQFKAKYGVHIAQVLFQKATAVFRERGVDRFIVMTAQSNEAANHFYRNQGCQLIRTQKFFHTPCNVFAGDLTSPPVG